MMDAVAFVMMYFGFYALGQSVMTGQLEALTLQDKQIITTQIRMKPLDVLPNDHHSGASIMDDSICLLLFLLSFVILLEYLNSYFVLNRDSYR